MPVTKDDVRRISHLARIKIEDSRLEGLCEDLNGIIRFVEQLDEVDCSQIDDAVQYVSELHERSDVVMECNPAVMDNAPQKECNMFVVPKVVG
jgi:aspartyl-tRNA(Asn)/glutamyl-tRNA(Gln) amidotransferase subunit C